MELLKMPWNMDKKVFKTEINSVTDNPNIFIDSDEIISGGNFHGQPGFSLRFRLLL
jgi:histidine ammonia-lyase